MLLRNMATQLQKKKMKMFFKVWKNEWKIIFGWIYLIMTRCRVDWKSLGLSQEIWHEMLREKKKVDKIFGMNHSCDFLWMSRLLAGIKICPRDENQSSKKKELRWIKIPNIKKILLNFENFLNKIPSHVKFTHLHSWHLLLCHSLKTFFHT